MPIEGYRSKEKHYYETYHILRSGEGSKIAKLEYKVKLNLIDERNLTTEWIHRELLSKAINEVKLISLELDI